MNFLKWGGAILPSSRAKLHLEHQASLWAPEFKQGHAYTIPHGKQRPGWQWELKSCSQRNGWRSPSGDPEERTWENMRTDSKCLKDTLCALLDRCAISVPTSSPYLQSQNIPGARYCSCSWDEAVDKTESCFKGTCLRKISGTWILRIHRCRVNESKTILIKMENKGRTFGLRWQ